MSLAALLPTFCRPLWRKYAPDQYPTTKDYYMSDQKTAEQLAGEVKGVLDARYHEFQASLDGKQAELRCMLDTQHDEIKSDLDSKHDKVKALAEEALGKAQRGEDLSVATKQLADEALTRSCRYHATQA